MDVIADSAFVRAIPKVELHLHIEGSLEPEMLFALAKRNNASIPFKSVEEVRKAYNFSCLQDFLDIYYQGMSVLLTEQDFYDLTMAYFARIARDGVVHTEIMFDPQGHTERGVSFETAISGISRAMGDAGNKYLISSKLICSFLRHLSQEAAFDVLEQSKPFRHLITSIGLDSSENGHPPGKFAEAYKRAREEFGYKLVAHAGEEGPAKNIEDALDILKVDRIDHGVRAMDSEELMDRLSKNRVGLTMCPLSNQKLQVTPDLAQHPAKMMVARGISVSLNSDDPAYFGGYIGDNYMALVSALKLTRGEVAQIAINSVESSFLSDDQKETIKNKIAFLCDAVKVASSSVSSTL